jgi:energy-coupling factor transport system permease protein
MTSVCSPLARANPLVLVAISVLAVPTSLALRELPVAAVGVAVLIVLALLLVPNVSRHPWRLLAPAVGALSVAWSTWWLGGQDESVAAAAGLRILVLALPGVLLAPLIDAAGLGDQLAQRLRLPARPVAAATVALQRLESLAGAWDQAARVRRVRGQGPTRNPVSRVRWAGALTFMVLVIALREAGRTAVAMDSRGFAGVTGRTWAEPAAWTRTDTAVLIGAACLAALPWAWMAR